TADAFGLKDSIKVQLTLESPGSRVFAGEAISLRCVVDEPSSLGWIYNWSQQINPRHQTAGDRYIITAMTAADQGPYWCTVRKNGTDEKLWHSNTITLNVSGGNTLDTHHASHSPSMLTVTPPGGQHFRGEHFSLQCEVAGRNSTGWTLKHLVKGKVESGCVTLGGRISMMKQGECVFSRLYSGNGGPYWCESTDGHQRSRIVNITVGYGYMIIQGPTHPVSAGENFKLRCIYWHDPSNATTFYKDGVEIVAQKSTELMIQNATKANEGFYKCIDSVNKQESSETWVSVTGETMKIPSRQSSSMKQHPTLAVTSGRRDFPSSNKYQWLLLDLRTPSF
uniref:Ig-like domain-containing protein n=1 Tax=Scleropages formosus TaxID=113540 RepID=A0A8C9SMN0_SCLFO